jgi:hypothetical protein
MRTLVAALVLFGCHSSPTRPDALHNHGVVSIDSRKYMSGGSTYGQGSVTAAFVRDQTDPFLGCERRTIGPCDTHYNCKPVRVDPLPDMAVSGDLGVSAYASAGTISVQGLPMTVSLIVMDMGMFAGQYSVFQQYTPMFMGGESITVRATGGEVPSFMGLVTAPSEPTLSQPITQPISRNADYGLSWSDGGAGQLRVSLTVPQMNGNPGIDCTFPAAAGAGAIPAQALSMLPSGQGIMSFSIISTSDFPAGDWQVELAATTGLLVGGVPYDQVSVILP